MVVELNSDGAIIAPLKSEWVGLANAKASVAIAHGRGSFANKRAGFGRHFSFSWVQSIKKALNNNVKGLSVEMQGFEPWSRQGSQRAFYVRIYA
jgi:hypothetical protein